jgi:abortive infection bacteriophage resistance protein
MFVNLALTRIDRQVDVAERRLENGLKTFEEMSDYGDRMKYTIKRHVEETLKELEQKRISTYVRSSNEIREVCSTTDAAIIKR